MDINVLLESGDIHLTWLSGGNFKLDGGAMSCSAESSVAELQS